MSAKPSYWSAAAKLRPCLRIRGTKRTGLSGWPGSCWQQIRIPQWTTSLSLINTSDIGITSVSIVFSLRKRINWIKSIHWHWLSPHTPHPYYILPALCWLRLLTLWCHIQDLCLFCSMDHMHSLSWKLQASHKYIYSVFVNSKMSKVDIIDKFSF